MKSKSGKGGARTAKLQAGKAGKTPKSAVSREGGKAKQISDKIGKLGGAGKDRGAAPLC